MVALLADRGPARPGDLTADRRRENVIRLQCRYLSRAGLVSTVAHDLFDLSDRTVSDDQFEDGYIDLTASLDVPERRLHRFDILDAEDIKLTNLELLNSDSGYELVADDRRTTEQRIRNVKTSRLERLLTEFPRAEPLSQQCAHWMRAMSGIHPFPDANHRTGMATLRGLLVRNGFEGLLDGWPGGDIGRAVTKGKLLRELHTEVRYDRLWLRDELYHHWHRYFRRLFRESDSETVGPSTDFLDGVLRYVRTQ